MGSMCRRTVRTFRLADVSCGEGIFLPFLYNTRTIRRGYVANNETSRTSDLSDVDANYKYGDQSDPVPPSSLARHVQQFHATKGTGHQERGSGTYKPYGGTTDAVHPSDDRSSSFVDPSQPKGETSGAHLRSGYIPFEGLPERRSLNDDLEGTTITPSERRAFQSLLEKRKPKPPTAGVSTVRPDTEPEQDANLEDDNDVADELEDLLKSALPKALHSTVQAAQDVRRQRYQQFAALRGKERLEAIERMEQAEAASRKRHEEAKKFKSLLFRAETDVDVWAMFHERVIERLIALNLDGRSDPALSPETTAMEESLTSPTISSDSTIGHGQQSDLQTADSASEPDPGASGTSMPYGNHGSTPSVVLETAKGTIIDVAADAEPATQGQDHEDSVREDAAQASPASDGGGENSVKLGFLLRSLIHSTQYHLKTHFPASPLALSVLPTIRSLGPAASALVLSTGHYNQHLDSSWKMFQDPGAMIAILREMDENVIEFNLRTSNQIVTALKFVRSVEEGRFGPSVQALWRMKGRMDAVRELERWGEIVLQRRAEQAARRARNEEAREAAEQEVGRMVKPSFRYEYDDPLAA